MTLFCALCLVQMQGYNPFELYPAGYNYFDADIAYAGVYLGTLGNAGLVAALLCLMLPLFWVVLVKGRTKERFLLTVPAALCLAVLLRMNVQAGLVALLLGMPITLCAALPLTREKRRWMWGALAALFVAALLWVYFGDHADGTLRELREILHGNWDPSFGSGRVYIWQTLWRRLDEHPWLGIGPDTLAALGIGMGTNAALVVDTAHNEYLNILFQQGLLSLIPYLLALLLSAVHWLCRAPRGAIAAALGSSVLLYCIQAFFSFSMCPSAGLFWIIWALLERTAYHEEVVL